jgi:O-antigen ligase
VNSPGQTRHSSDRSEELPGSVAAGILLCVTVVATVSWGCVSPEAGAAWTAVVCALGCAGVLGMLLRGTRLKLVPGSLPLIFFIALALLQVVPFGADLSAAAQDATGMTRSAAMSWIPAATLSHGRQWIALFVVFTIGAMLFAHPRRMRRLPWAMLLVACVLSSYYALNPFLAYVPDHVAIDGEGAFSRHVFGTYLNRNHVAAFLVMSIVLGVGLFVTRHRTLCHRSGGFRRRQGYIVAMTLLSLAGLLLTQSRGGMINLVVGGLTLAILVPRRPAGSCRWMPLVAILGLVAVLPFALPAEFAARFLDISHDVTAAGSRGDLWQSAWNVFEMSPIVGHGLGTFGDVAVLGQSENVIGHLEHAHCDALEYLAETGVIGLNLLLWAGVLLLVHIVRRCRDTRGDRRTVLAAAAIAALLGMAAQSCVDFNTQIPALAAWAALLAGTASGAMANANGLPPIGTQAPRWILPPVMVALGLAAVIAGRQSWSYRVQHQVPVGATGAIALATLADAAAIHACRGEAFSRAAWLAASTEEGPRDLASIHSLATRAVHENPLDARAWHALALADIWSGEALTLSSLRRAVDFTPPGDRVGRRIELGMQLLASRRSNSARSWFRDLFADPAVDSMHVLRRLHAEDALSLDLVPLIPRAGGASLRRFADSLLHNGEIRKREKILDLLLDRLPNRDRLTIRDDATLVENHVHETFDEHGHRIHVELTIGVPPGYAFDSQMMCLNLLGAHATIEHYFRPRPGTSRHILAVSPSTPPGKYDLALQAFTNGVRFPLALITVAETGVHLTPGRTLPAERALYWAPEEPVQRDSHAGLELAPGTRLWRRIRLSKPGGELVISCDEATPIRAVFNGTDLPRVNEPSALDGRYRLPAGIADGRLELTLERASSESATATRVLRITLLAETGR